MDLLSKCSLMPVNSSLRASFALSVWTDPQLPATISLLFSGTSFLVPLFWYGELSQGYCRQQRSRAPERHVSDQIAANSPH